MAELLHLRQGRRDRPAVVFVHGLGGHPVDTWRHAGTPATDFWPHWVSEATGCDCWTLGYDAALSAWEDQAMPLPDQGDQVADLLASEPGLRARRLVLVGHSMGGLVIKTVLMHGRTKGDKRIGDMVSRVAAVVFVGTPHMGSQLAGIARALNWLMRTNIQVGNMVAHDAHLSTLNQQFRQAREDAGLQVKVFAERQNVSVGFSVLGLRVRIGGIRVVDASSSDPGLVGVTAVPIAADHFSICKPRDRGAQIHKSLCDFINGVFDDQQSAAYGSTSPVATPGDAAAAIDLSRLRAETRSGRLTGPQDNRLQPRERGVYGRESEIAQVLAFLQGTGDAALVTAKEIAGVGGIGKTEVCKAALKAWLTSAPQAEAYYVDVPDRSGVAELLDRLMQAIGATSADSLEQVLATLPAGLYYLDNLESVAEQPEGQAVLRAMRQRPGIRLLVSSRVSVASIFGAPILIGVLPDAAALKLFRELWAGQERLPEDAGLAPFVVGKLGAHALTVTLVARLGDGYTFNELLDRWRAAGAAAARDPQDASRLGSLALSLNLTAQALQPRAGALALWVAAALFADGLPDELLQQLESAGGWVDARVWLARHHVLTRRDGQWHMLPPLARYALEASLCGESGFDWSQSRGPLRALFSEAAARADSIASTNAALAARGWLLTHFSTLDRLLRHDLRASPIDEDWLERINHQLLNFYGFRASVSRELLSSLLPSLRRPADALRVLGQLEAQLGNPDEARELYEKALVLSESEQLKVGQANTLRSLGNLERELGRPDEARKLYGRALVLYEEELSEMGQANTLESLGDLELRLGRLTDASVQLNRALALYEGEKSGLGQANTLLSLGHVESILGNFDEARGHYDRALAMHEMEQSDLGQAGALQGLGDLASKSGRLDDARSLYRRAKALYESEGSGLGQANVLKALGDLDVRLAKPSEARECYDRALELYEREHNGLGQANTLQVIGDLLQADKRFEKAAQTYQQALAQYARQQDPMGTAYTFIELARCLHALKQMPLRDVAIVKSLAAAEAAGTPAVRNYAIRALEKMVGGPAPARAWLREHGARD